MYILAPWKKTDPIVRWNLPDRIFFGHGACHILAGAFLDKAINPEFRAYWIKPIAHPGHHIFVSDGEIAFDYHGYSVLERLQTHHRKVWEHQHPGWDATVESVDFDLFDTEELNCRSMRGPDQFFRDPVHRANRFLDQIDHTFVQNKVRRSLRRPLASR